MQKNHLLLFVILVSLFGCSKSVNLKVPKSAEMYEASAPVYVTDAGAEIYLNGYFKQVEKIDSISLENYTFKLSDDKRWLYVTPTESTPSLEVAQAWIKGYAHSIVLLYQKMTQYEFVFDSKGFNYKQILLAGSFNSWTPIDTLMNDKGQWRKILKLSPGRYQYQVVVDGKWMLDPDNRVQESNNIGGFNSVLVISDPAENAPKLYTKTFTERTIEIGINGEADKIVCLWNNYSVPFTVQNNTIAVDIPKNAKKLNRSYLRVWTNNEFGYSNDVLVPLEFGKVISDAAQLKRTDKHAQVLYFMLVDRFNNGDKSIDNPLNDPEIHEKANYWGGDLAGITQKVNDGYFTELGVSMIWLSPITQNPKEGFVEYPAPHRKYSGYHGYWPITLTTVDNRFGTAKDLSDLVSSTHEKDMNIILDYVSNHVHQQNKNYIDNPHWATQLDLPDGRKNIRIWEEHRLTTWFDTFLPSLNFDLPEVENMMSDSAMFWITEYNIDGFRHDATKHIPTPYWRTLTKKLRDETKNEFVFQIGETFGSRELIRSYVGTDLLDGQFDFNLYFDMRNIMASDKESFAKLSQSLKESQKYYGSHSLMGNITGNHDLPRFISFAGGALKFDEDDKEAGWTRDIQVVDTIGYYKLLQVSAFIHTIPGIPVTYYGDEIGMPGAGDPDNRRPMKFDSLTVFEQMVKDQTTQIIKERRDNLALIYGDLILLHTDDHTMVYARKYFEKVSIIAFNKFNQSEILIIKLPKYLDVKELTSLQGCDFQLVDDELEITLKPYSYCILNKE
ncbi:MAG: alpha-amylase family glycosyl hydrolase [Bacteroidales bacterium]